MSESKPRCISEKIIKPIVRDTTYVNPFNSYRVKQKGPPMHVLRKMRSQSEEGSTGAKIANRNPSISRLNS